MQKSLPYLWPKWRQNSQKRYPIYDQNGWKTLPFGAAHTYIAHIREYPPRVETSVPVSNSHFRTTLTRTITLHLATYATICKAWLWQEEQGLGGLYQNEHSPNLAFITWLSLRLKAVIIITVYKYHNIWVLLVESAWSLELPQFGCLGKEKNTSLEWSWW